MILHKHHCCFLSPRPESLPIIDLGLRHTEQISLLEKMQNALLAEQAVLIDLGYNHCPKCGQKIKKNALIPLVSTLR